jgi:2OG-Fe(II) oxygenase superfamily
MIALRTAIRNRQWWYRSDPFPHFTAMDVFEREVAGELERAFTDVLACGTSSGKDRVRFSQNMIYSDAYSWNFPADVSGPLALFYSREWHDLLVDLTGIRASGDVNGALHHHHLGSTHGTVHRDLNIAWFSDQPRSDGINPMDVRRCSYTHGVTAPGVKGRKVARAVTMIYYLANRPWFPGDGGETGLYRKATDPVERPAATAPPINNSILIFENGPGSYHSFIRNRRNPRNSVILWLHRTIADTVERWGFKRLGRF